MSRLHELTNRRPGLCLDVIHHTRKAKSDDPIDDISGTYGLTAACDSYCVLRHHEDGAVMHVGGRLWDRDESDFRLRRAGRQSWELVGEFRNLTSEQEATVEHLRRCGGCSGSELAKQLGITRQSAGERLRAVLEKGAATRRGDTFYAKT
jgi:hypothetical protein